MGCAGSKELVEGIHACLDYSMNDLGVSFKILNELFTEAKDVIKSLEEIRKVVIDGRDEIIVTSGACSYIDPKIEYCLEGILWKLSADNDGNLNKAEIYCDPDTNSLSQAGKKNSEEGITAFERLAIYLGNCVNDIPEQMKIILEKFSDLKSKLLTNPKFLEKQIQESLKAGSSEILKKTLKNYKQNIDKFRNAVTAAPKINEELISIIHLSFAIQHILVDKEEVRRIDEIGSKAKEKNMMKIHEITWNLMPYAKLRYGFKPEDGLKLWDERKNIKKKYLK